MIRAEGECEDNETGIHRRIVDYGMQQHPATAIARAAGPATIETRPASAASISDLPVCLRDV